MQRMLFEPGTWSASALKVSRRQFLKRFESGDTRPAAVCTSRICPKTTQF